MHRTPEASCRAGAVDFAQILGGVAQIGSHAEGHDSLANWRTDSLGNAYGTSVIRGAVCAMPRASWLSVSSTFRSLTSIVIIGSTLLAGSWVDALPGGVAPRQAEVGWVQVPRSLPSSSHRPPYTAASTEMAGTMNAVSAAPLAEMGQSLPSFQEHHDCHQ